MATTALAITVLVKPAVYETLDAKAVEGVLEAEQTVLPSLEKIVEKGRQQLIAKSPYSATNLPQASPAITPVGKLDGIGFDVVTSVRRTNPEYSVAYHAIEGFLNFLQQDWEDGIRRVGVRTYQQEPELRAPYVELEYLMRRAMQYISPVIMDSLGVKQDIETAAPESYDTMELNRLVVGDEQIMEFDIEKPGTAKLWYLARRFAKEIVKETVNPLGNEIERKSGVGKQPVPERMQRFIEQVDKYIILQTTKKATRPAYSTAVKEIFTIPELEEGDEVRGPIIIPTAETFMSLLESYRKPVSDSLSSWRKLRLHLSELAVLFYGLESHPKVMEQFPELPRYDLRREDGKMFVSLQGVLDRMEKLSAKPPQKIIGKPKIAAIV